MLDAVRSGEADVSVASRFAEGASMEEWGRPDREKLSNAANAMALFVGARHPETLAGIMMLSGWELLRHTRAAEERRPSASRPATASTS